MLKFPVRVTLPFVTCRDFRNQDMLLKKTYTNTVKSINITHLYHPFWNKIKFLVDQLIIPHMSMS